MNGDFIWRDAGRTVVFRPNGVAQAPRLLREHQLQPFALVTTSRALAGAPELAAEADTVHEIGPGQVPDLAADLLGAADLLPAMREESLPRPGGSAIVGLGGGRPIDVAKALGAVSGARVAAVPTTMSGAEMTGIHRLPSGAESRANGLVRAELVIADPAAMTSQPEPRLRASSMNALAHGADSLYTPFTNPASEMAALRGADLIASALDQPREERNPAPLALGSLLCGYAIDSASFGVHHVVCQSLVRICGGSHAETNAAVLPRTLALLVERAPDRLADLAVAIGAEPDPAAVEARVLELGGDPPGLGAGGADASRVGEALDAMLARPELAFTPRPPDREELAQLIERCW